MYVETACSKYHIIVFFLFFNFIFPLKFINSEKATKFCGISTLLLTGTIHRTKVKWPSQNIWILRIWMHFFWSTKKMKNWLDKETDQKYMDAANEFSKMLGRYSFVNLRNFLKDLNTLEIYNYLFYILNWKTFASMNLKYEFSKALTYIEYCRMKLWLDQAEYFLLLFHYIFQPFNFQCFSNL